MGKRYSEALWANVRLHYVEGVDVEGRFVGYPSLPEVAEAHGIPRRTVHDRARAEDWDAARRLHMDRMSAARRQAMAANFATDMLSASERAMRVARSGLWLAQATGAAWVDEARYLDDEGRERANPDALPSPLELRRLGAAAKLFFDLADQVAGHHPDDAAGGLGELEVAERELSAGLEAYLQAQVDAAQADLAERGTPQQ